MLDPDFLRRQAQRCLAFSRTTYDLTTARQLRSLADELHAKASELDDKDSNLPLYMIGRNGSPEGERDLD